MHVVFPPGKEQSMTDPTSPLNIVWLGEMTVAKTKHDSPLNHITPCSDEIQWQP